MTTGAPFDVAQGMLCLPACLPCWHRQAPRQAGAFAGDTPIRLPLKPEDPYVRIPASARIAFATSVARKPRNSRAAAPSAVTIAA